MFSKFLVLAFSLTSTVFAQYFPRFGDYRIENFLVGSGCTPQVLTTLQIDNAATAYILANLGANGACRFKVRRPDVNSFIAGLDGCFPPQNAATAPFALPHFFLRNNDFLVQDLGVNNVTVKILSTNLTAENFFWINVTAIGCKIDFYAVYNPYAVQYNYTVDFDNVNGTCFVTNRTTVVLGEPFAEKAAALISKFNCTDLNQDTILPWSSEPFNGTAYTPVIPSSHSGAAGTGAATATASHGGSNSGSGGGATGGSGGQTGAHGATTTASSHANRTTTTTATKTATTTESAAATNNKVVSGLFAFLAGLLAL